MELYDISTINELLSRHGLRFSKALGQNFLTAAWVPERISEASGADKGCGVLEIGPGIGVLTRRLSEAAGKVVAVELDKGLIPVLRETLDGYDNVKVINDNILKVDLSELVEENFGGLKPVVCANLPYNITSPVLTELIDSGCFDSITVMVQREVAKRLCSSPGSSDYGAFTVYVNYHTRPTVLFDVPPDCFVPRPKVYSSVIRLDRLKRESVPVDEKLFFRIVRASFEQRRKTLVNGLMPLFGDKRIITETVVGCGFDEKVRGETLGIEEFIRLADAFALRADVSRSS
ncbi:MAG: 16S rRNA (adenine(1518)-N(6)/adenine(1519)-N(6))-dimethyltransferase RsmA [Oscillospiraceae bacterium]|jgi:16S rRNA (adenine1518-N6/adenine1519-N6)-dimethyltransferase|nr:16S rRNA (adenine(1518)-N(6)/adenine(1519)-N(6))-dimethyltransferase RsmA [Oscillospiraceae bacterium]